MQMEMQMMMMQQQQQSNQNQNQYQTMNQQQQQMQQQYQTLLPSSLFPIQRAQAQDDQEVPARPATPYEEDFLNTIMHSHHSHHDEVQVPQAVVHHVEQHQE